MKHVLVEYIVQSGSKFSVMVDESTTVSSKCTLIVYVRLEYDGEVTNYFWDLVELKDKTGGGIAVAIKRTLIDNGLTEEIIKHKLIGFGSDGASAMLGLYSGAAVKLKQLLGIDFKTFHCMAHRLELAVHGVIKTMNTLSHFRYFCDEFYHFYAHSSKRLVELETCAKELSTELLKIGKVFDVRWLMSMQ